jgi:hypothetical protein
MAWDRTLAILFAPASGIPNIVQDSIQFDFLPWYVKSIKNQIYTLSYHRPCNLQDLAKMMQDSPHSNVTPPPRVRP